MIAAIGDVHGCAQELRELIAKLLERFGDTPATIVMLGDYVDRGPDSAGVLDILMEWDHPTIKLVCLMGNHDYMMIQTVLHHNAEAREVWLDDDSGGVMTIMSMTDEITDYAEWMADNLVPSYQVGNLFFAHAGVDPEKPIAEQSPDDLMWIREPFLSFPGDFGVRVVHGHSPAFGAPDVRDNRVNLDTGCVFGGFLSAAVFDDAENLVAIETVDPVLVI
jgi:serine/threonine protein phosphatase 1